MLNGLAWAHRGSQTLDWQSASLYGSDVGVLPVCYNSIPLIFSGTPNHESRDCDSFVYFWVPFHPTGLPHPALIQGYIKCISSLTAT